MFLVVFVDFVDYCVGVFEFGDVFFWVFEVELEKIRIDFVVGGGGYFDIL